MTAADTWKVATLFVLAVTPVLYLPLRSAARPEFVQVGHFDATGEFHALDLTQIGNLLWYLSGRQFDMLMLARAPLDYGQEALRFLYWLWAAFLGIGLPLGLVGIWSLWQRNRVVAVAMVLTALPHALFFIGYPAVDKETMFLPVFLVWAVLLGVGMARILHRFPKQVHLLALLLPASLLYVNLPYADVSEFRAPYEQAGKRLMEADAGALYLANWGDAELMRYHQIVRGLRRDVEVVNLFFITPDTLAALLAYQLDGRGSAYSTKALSIPARPFLFEEVGYGYRILSRNERP